MNVLNAKKIKPAKHDDLQSQYLWAETGGLKVQCHSWLLKERETTLVYMRPFIILYTLSRVLGRCLSGYKH